LILRQSTRHRDGPPAARVHRYFAGGGVPGCKQAVIDVNSAAQYRQTYT
jgi:hypothetical protein